MTRNSKALGLAMVAVLAMSAVVASAAQAQFTTNAAPTTVTATSSTGNDVFAVDGSSVECAGHFQGTVTETMVSSITVAATYTSCKAFGFASATVNMNGCDYVFYATGSVDIVCPTGKSIIITASTCEVQIGAQTKRSRVYLTNFHPHILADAEVGFITANRTKDGFLCPLTGTGHVSNVTYNQAYAIQFIPAGWGWTISVD